MFIVNKHFFTALPVLAWFNGRKQASQQLHSCWDHAEMGPQTDQHIRPVAYPRNTHDSTLKWLALAVIDVKFTEEQIHAEHNWLRVQPHDLQRSRHVFVKLSVGTQRSIYSRTICRLTFFFCNVTNFVIHLLLLHCFKGNTSKTPERWGGVIMGFFFNTIPSWTELNWCKMTNVVSFWKNGVL